MKRLSIVFIIAIFQSIVGIAQDTTINNNIIVDSGLYYTRYKNLPISSQPLKQIDKSLTGVQQVNAVNRIEEMFYQQLSTDGSAHKPLFIKLPDILSFDYQPNIYNAVRFTRDNIKFYNVYKAYSELRYSTTLNSSLYFSAIHAQNVFKNLQIGLQYDVNYSDGSFDKSQVRNQFFNATARYKNSKETYEGYLGFIHNRAMQNESGGIKSDSSFSVQEYSSLSAYPVNTSSAYSKWKSVEGFLTQRFNFGKLISNNGFINGLSLVHDLSYFQNSRIYHDSNPTEGFYQSIYFDSTLTNDSLSTQRIQNIISLRNDGELPFVIGIKHDYVLFSDTLNSERSSNFTPYFEIGVNIKDFKLNFNGEYILSNARYNKDFQIGGDLKIKDFYANVKLMNKSVDYFYTRYSTNNFRWTNNFKKIEMFNANVGYCFKDYLKVNIGYFTLNNLVWIGEDLLPKQATQTTNLLQASILHNFHLGIFNFNGIVSLQKLSTQEAISLPVFQTKQSVSINFKMFGKKLDTQIGFDFRYNTLYFGDSFIPAMGSFIHQDQVEIGNYLYTDFFVKAQLDRVKLFVALTHPYAGLINYNYYYTPHYPAENLNLRFGVTWMFFD
ncbi:MAG: putative porin [Bacteroidales bacterium]